MDLRIAKKICFCMFKFRWIFISVVTMTAVVATGRAEHQHHNPKTGSSHIGAPHADGKSDVSRTAASPVNIPPESSSLTTNCTTQFGATLEEDLAKIDSYQFEGIDKYMKDLFPLDQPEQDIPEVPVFVTGFSSNHYEEGKALLKNLEKTVRNHYKNVTVILFDIGLTRDQAQRIKDEFSLELRAFPFDKYPSHVRRLQTYTWKPIIIQTVAKEHPFLFWVDASIRFKTGELRDLFKQVKKHGLVNRHMGTKPTGSISERTHQATFQYLQEDPCLYGMQMEKAGGFIFLLANQFITRYFLRPWVSCALAAGCMDPIPGSGRLIMCPANKKHHTYHLCHRFDQSVLGILFTRLFHRNLKDHALDLKYLMVCGGTKIGPHFCYHYEQGLNNSELELTD